MKATLILANGSVFSGTSIGSTSDRVCEMVFNTSMTGYQEILTDPSYAGQGIVMSYPLIGNYGVNHEDNESSRPWAEAFVVRHLSPIGSNFRCEETLDHYLKKHDITGIEGVDTRALTKILRSQGSMNGMVTCAEHFNVAEILEKLKAYRVEGTVERVSRKEPEDCPAYGEEKYKVAMMDYGVKQNMIECLRRRGCRVTAFPAHTPAETVLSGAAVLKNSIGVFGVLAVLGTCAVPFLRIGIQYLLYKVAAFAAGTVSSPPLVKLVDRLGSAFGLILGMVGSCALLITVAVLSSLLAVGV